MKTYFASPLALRFIEVPLYLILFIFQKVGGGGGGGRGLPRAEARKFSLYNSLRKEATRHRLRKLRVKLVRRERGDP